MNSSRILACVGVFTLYVVACNDKDVSIVEPGNGGSGGNGGSNTAGNGGSGVSGSGGSPSGGNGGASGAPSAGNGGMSGAAGSPPLDTDAGTDSGTPPGPYAEVCTGYCAARTAWAAATGDAGVNCPTFASAGCQAACEGELDTIVQAGCTPAAAIAAYECHTTANVWFCADTSVPPNNCESNFGFDGTQFTCGTNCDSTCNPQAGVINSCLIGAAVCN